LVNRGGDWAWKLPTDAIVGLMYCPRMCVDDAAIVLRIR